MNYLYEKDKELLEYSASIENKLSETYLEPKTHRFIVMSQYNNMIESMFEEFVLDKIFKIL